jgi:hypothetical protein
MEYPFLVMDGYYLIVSMPKGVEWGKRCTVKMNLGGINGAKSQS